MKIQNLKTKVIGPVLLLIPMACMHLGDGHHDGDHGGHHSLQYLRSSLHELVAGATTAERDMSIHQSDSEER